MPIFSIVIPTFNRKPFLRKAIDSVINQSFKDWELIITDDGSMDETEDLVKNYKDQRIKYFYQENKGVANARNNCIKKSNGEYICPLDSDDWWHEDKLKIQTEYFKKYPQYKIFHTQELWYRNGTLLNQKKKHEKPNQIIFPQCLKLCCVSISTAIIHKTIFDELGLFDETLPACEDYDFWLRVSLKYPVLLIDKPLTLKDGGRPDQLSSQHGLEKYRIIALEKFMKTDYLNDAQKAMINNELTEKIKIYLNGCVKRNKREETEYYSNLLKIYEGTSTINR